MRLQVTPGRVRFYFALLRGHQQAVETLYADIQTIKGVRRVSVSIVTGRVHIEYDEDLASLQSVLRAVVRTKAFGNVVPLLPLSEQRLQPLRFRLPHKDTVMKWAGVALQIGLCLYLDKKLSKGSAGTLSEA